MSLILVLKFVIRLWESHWPDRCVQDAKIASSAFLCCITKNVLVRYESTHGSRFARSSIRLASASLGKVSLIGSHFNGRFSS